MSTTVTPETYIRAEVDGRFGVFHQRAGNALVNQVLHEFAIDAASADPFTPPDWDWDSMFALRAQYEQQFRTFAPYPGGWMGRRGKADDETRHLAVAGAWGLFPEEEAVYINDTGPEDASKGYVATYELPPFDAFWSISVYGSDAFFASDNATLGASNTTFNDDGHVQRPLRVTRCRRRPAQPPRHHRRLERPVPDLQAWTRGARAPLRPARGGGVLAMTCSGPPARHD